MTRCTIPNCRAPATERYCGHELCEPHKDAAMHGDWEAWSVKDGEAAVEKVKEENRK